MNGSDNLAPLLGCPFCGGAMTVQSNRDWHRIVGQHDEQCPFDVGDPAITVPAEQQALAWAIETWNRRTPPPQASGGEPDVHREPCHACGGSGHVDDVQASVEDVEAQAVEYLRDLLRFVNIEAEKCDASNDRRFFDSQVKDIERVIAALRTRSGGVGVGELRDLAPRALELANRLVASGPKAAHVSASECHEIAEFVRATVAIIDHAGRGDA